MHQWFKKNSFQNNQEYAEEILNKFNLTKYHFTYNYGDLCLWIENNLKKYKIVVNRKECKMDIYRCNVNVRMNKYTKENMIIKKSFEDNCIWNCIRWVFNDSKI